MKIASFKSNKPIDLKENTPIDQLDHRYGHGTWILDKDLEDLAAKKFHINGRGITFFDLIECFKCSKGKAQCRLKNACKEKIDKNGKKFSLLFTLDNERTKPQQYYPSCIKAKIIENKRKRQTRLIGTTGVSSSNKSSFSSSSHYPLHNAIEQQMVLSFLTQLSSLPFQQLNMPNIHLWLRIDKNHYEEINQKPWSDDNKTKIERERICLREVVFQFHKRGSIEIEISSSKYPFPIETDDDINNLFVFLGQVKDRLANILMDPRERIVPSVNKWILKYCDFNKDIELDEKTIGQLIDLNLQIKYVGKAFRLYVKNLDERFELRGEQVMKVNQPITTFLDNTILNPLHLIDSKFNEFANNIEKKLNEINNRIEKLEK